MKKMLKISAISVWSIFALVGIFLSGGYFAMRWGLTNVPGAISFDTQYLSPAISKPENALAAAQTSVSLTSMQNWAEEANAAVLFCSISALFESYPNSARNILTTYERTHSFATAYQQLALVNGYADAMTQEHLNKCKEKQDSLTLSLRTLNGESFTLPIPWVETPEWKTFATGIVKEKDTIKRVAEETNVPARLIASMVISEQLRLYDSNRQTFKGYFAPLGILGTETMFSLGVTGVKAQTAEMIEQHLSDTTSPFYPGPQYAGLITYTSQEDKGAVMISRLTNTKDHYYSYLYAALFIKEVEAQWSRSGYDISGQPGILATLWNIGFRNSVPNADPKIGGTEINVGGQTYTFGALAYEFYYSGQLTKAFPFEETHENSTRESMQIQ